MPQLFKPRSNTIARALILGFVLSIAFLGWAAHAVFWSPYTTRVNIPIDQPVPFSHRHHAGQLGIDCRYCHTSVEKSPFAGMPDTATCMTCHSQLFTSAPLLAPVRESLASGRPIRWKQVNKVPDFVFFNHSIHVAKGIGCTTCHGPIGDMTLTWKSETLYMKWCLNCHRGPDNFVRPREHVFDPAWIAPSNQAIAGEALARAGHINIKNITDCGTCHR